MWKNTILSLIALSSFAVVGCGGASEDGTMRAEEPHNQPVDAHARAERDERPNAERGESARRESAPRETAPREEVTAQDQSNDDGDMRITQDIRQRVIANDGLSFSAKNCTIVTRAGVVTLRGEVDSARERTLIASLARGAAGVRSVEDQLTVDGH